MNWWSDKPTEGGDVEDQTQSWAETPPATSSTTNAGIPTATNGTASASSTEKPSGWRRWCPFVPSIVLCTLFLISFGLEFNDSSLPVMWAIFYALSAVLCVTGILLKPCCSNRLGLVFAASMMIWAMILIIISAVDLSKTEKGGDTEGGDSNSNTKREEIAFEVAGSSLAFCSALYHGCLLWMAQKE